MIAPGAGSALTLQMGVSGAASITWHTPGGLPNVDFSASISGSISANASTQTVPSGADELIQVVLNSIDTSGLNIDIDLGGIPLPLGPILDGLLDAVSTLLNQTLSGFTINVYSLSPIALNFAGQSTALTWATS